MPPSERGEEAFWVFVSSNPVAATVCTGPQSGRDEVWAFEYDPAFIHSPRYAKCQARPLRECSHHTQATGVASLCCAVPAFCRPRSCR